LKTTLFPEPRPATLSATATSNSAGDAQGISDANGPRQTGEWLLPSAYPPAAFPSWHRR